MKRVKLKISYKEIKIGSIVELWPSDFMPNLICGRVVVKQFGEIRGEEGIDKYMVEVEYLEKRCKDMEQPFWLPLGVFLEHLKPDWAIQELIKMGYDREGFLAGEYDDFIK